MSFGSTHHIAPPRVAARSFLFVLGLLTCAGVARAQSPAAPSGVRLVIQRDNAIDVLWNDNSNNEAAFDVFRKAGNGAYALLTAVDANITVFQDRNSGIRPNVRFCYQVAARNAFGSSPRSDEACITVPPRPNPPSNLTWSRDGSSSPIDLSWTDNSDNEEAFLVYRDTDGSAFVLYDTVSANVTVFSDMVLRTEGTYCYFVSAINRAGESPSSDPACLDVVDGTPVPPTSIEAESISDTGIQIKWTFGMINFATLFVERSEDSQATWTDIFQTTEIAQDFRDTALLPNTEYCYRVRLENSSATAGFSSVSCATTAFAVPEAPDGVGAVALEGGSISVAWQPVVSAEIQYRVESQSGDSGFDVVADSLSQTLYIDTDLDPDLIHCYRVRAYNPAFVSEWSAIACAIVAPDPVASLSAIPSPGNQTSQITVSWQPGSDVTVTSFRVAYRAAGEGSFSDPVAVASNETVITDLSDATAYEVSVTATRVIDELTAKSSPVTTSTQTVLAFWPGDVNGDGAVGAPDVVSLTAPACFGATTSFSTDGLNVAWTMVPVDLAGGDPSLLRCDTDRSGSVNVFDFLAIASNAGRTTGKGTGEASAAIVDDAHRARIASLFASFQPAAGNQEQEQLKDDLAQILKKSVADLPEKLGLSTVYPNPVSGRFSATVELPASAPVTILLVNSAGQLVQRTGEQNMGAGRQTITFETALLAPGLYFVVVESGGKRLTRPVTVLR